MQVNSMEYVNESLNLSCWEKSLELSTSLALPAFLAPLQTAIFILYLVAGLPLNCFIIFLVVKFKELRKRDFLLATHVVMADLLVIFGLPVSVASLLVGVREVHNSSSCSAVGFIVLLFNGVRFTMMFVLCTDRFCAVFSPFYYSSRRGALLATLPFFVWGIWIVLAGVPLGIDCYGYEPTTGFCIMQSHCSTACNVYRFAILSAMTLLGGVIPIVLYSMLFCKARRLAKASCEANAIVPPHSRRRHATVTFFILFIALLGCSIPTYLVFFLSPLADKFRQFFWAYFGISLSLFEAVLLADPIALMRNREVRDCVNKLTQGCLKTKADYRGIQILKRTATHSTIMAAAASIPSLNNV